MDSWKKFNKTTLQPKEAFYDELNKEGISEEDYAHTEEVCKEFNIKNVGEYYDLYVQSNTTLLADVF